MEKRERKEKNTGKILRRIIVCIICAALLAVGLFLWFFVFEVTPLPQRMQDSLYPPEPTPVPTPTPEPSPTPEPTVYIPKPEVNIYTARISVGAETVHGCLRVHYVNTGTDTIYSVPFHLYPNTVTPGVFTVNGLSLDGKEAYYVLQEDVLSVPLVMELLPGEDCVIYIDFTVNLYAGAYGKDGKLSHLLPAAAVYENDWMLDAAPEDVYYTAPAAYSIIIEGEADCGLPRSGDGCYYGENVQGLTITLK